MEWMIALPLVTAHNMGAMANLRSLTRYLGARADEERQRGDMAAAMLHYEAAIHLGHVIRVNAYSMDEPLIGRGVTGTAAGEMLRPAETARVDATLEGEERDRLRTQLRAAALAKWAAEHGRADLGAVCVEDVRAYATLLTRIKSVLPRQAGLYDTVWEGGTLYGLAVNAAMGGMVGLAVIVLLAWLVGRGLRTRNEGTLMGWLQAAALLVAVLLPGQVAVLCTAIWLERQAGVDVPDASMPPTTLLVWMGVAGAVLWVVGVVVVARRRKAKVLPMAAAMVGPTVAAVVLLAVLGLVPVERNFKKVNDQYKQMVMVGEMKYWGLDGGEGTVKGGK
jgi:hypothetical protein